MTRCRCRVYSAVLRAQLRTAAHFRSNVLAWVLLSPLELGTLYLLWSVVYRYADSVGGLGFEDMMVYYLVVHLLRRIVRPVLATNYEVWNEINSGSLDLYLARPLSFGGFCLFRSLGSPIIELLIGVPFFGLFCLILGMYPHGSLGAVLLFPVSLLAGYLIMFLIQLLIGCLTFWVERIFGVRDIVLNLLALLSGHLIPVSALPPPVAAVARYLPFEGIYYIPAQVLGQTRSAGEAIGLVAVQLLWIVVLWALAAIVWARGVRRYTSQGG